MSILRKLLIANSLVLSMTVEAAQNIGNAAENLNAITGGVQTLMELVSFVIGAALVLGAFMLYRQHRVNPKLVPLTTPVILAILGTGTLTFLYYTSEGFRQFGKETGALDAMIREPNKVVVEQPEDVSAPEQLYQPNTQQKPQEDKYW